MNEYLEMLNKNNYELLTEDEERIICQHIELGDKNAINDLVIHNLKLVPYVIHKYNYKSEQIQEDDLIQEGNIALIDAAKRFDYKAGIKFSTYAVSYIKNRILEYIASHSIPISMSKNKFWELHRFAKEYELLKQKYKRVPTYVEIFNELGIKEKEANNYLKLMSIFNFDSLDRKINKDDDDFSLLDLNTVHKIDEIENDEIFDSILQHEIQRSIENALNCLNEKERIVICLKFGINKDNVEYSLKEISSLMQVSKQRVHYLEQRALLKLRNNKKLAIETGHTPVICNNETLIRTYKGSNSEISRYVDSLIIPNIKKTNIKEILDANNIKTIANFKNHTYASIYGMQLDDYIFIKQNLNNYAC